MGEVVYLAARNGHADACRLLLERSAAPNAARTDGTTPCTASFRVVCFAF
jgi:ankyrin repeat protein